MKFGGTSVANGKSIRQVAKLIQDNKNKNYEIVIVVSALEGITNQLIQVAEKAKKGNKDYLQKFKNKISERHLVAIDEAIKHNQLKKNTEQVIKKLIKETNIKGGSIPL